jgi:hypothetical protein
VKSRSTPGRGIPGIGEPPRWLKPRSAERLAATALLAVSLAWLAACGGESTNTSLTSGTIKLHDQGWYCGGHVDVDRLEVMIRNVPVDAVEIGFGCNGRIGELVVVQYQQDGVKVTAGSYDLVVEKGTIECVEQKIGGHQDGVQAMGGTRITFKNLRVDCPTRSSGFFVREGGRGDELPTEVVCEDCWIRGGGYSVRVNESVRSGVRNSTVCAGEFGGIKILEGAVDPVERGNSVVSCS